MAVTIANYSYRQKITGDAPASSLGGFRVLITEGSVDSTFWDNVDNGGGDVRASINVDGTSQLPLQIVLCNTSTQKLLAYVRFPTYSTSARELHVFCGNTGQTQPSVTSTYGRNNVNQDSTFSSDLESLSPVDSSGNTSLTASASGITQATDGGAQGNGNIFSGGAGVGYTIADNSVVNNDYISLSAWVVLSGNAPFARLLGKQYQVNLLIKNGKPSVELWTSSGVQQQAATTNLTIGAKTHVAYVYNGSNVSFYLNGSLDRSASISTSTLSTSSSDLHIARRNGSVESFNGKIYEINTTGLARSADYIASEYANQDNPTNFWTQSTPDDPSGGGGSSISASVAQTITKPIFSIASSFVAPVTISADIAYTIAKPIFATAASKVVPTFTSGLAFNVAKPVFATTASTTVPVFTSALAVDISKPVFAVSAENGQLVITSAIAASISKPVFSVAADNQVLIINSAIALSVSKPIFSVASSSIVPIFTASTAFDVTKPIFSIASTATEPGNASASVSVLVDAPIFSVSTSLINPLLSTIDFSIDAPVFSVLNSATRPTLSAEITVDVTAPTFSVIANNGIQVYYYRSGTQVITYSQNTQIKIRTLNTNQPLYTSARHRKI